MRGEELPRRILEPSDFHSDLLLSTVPTMRFAVGSLIFTFLRDCNILVDRTSYVLRCSLRGRCPRITVILSFADNDATCHFDDVLPTNAIVDRLHRYNIIKVYISMIGYLILGAYRRYP